MSEERMNKEPKRPAMGPRRGGPHASFLCVVFSH